LALAALWVIAAGSSLLLTQGGPQGSVDPSLITLLRLMAAIKAAMAVAAALLVDWRLARPMPAAMACGYGVAVALMAAASGMIWQMSHLMVAGVLFHAGLLLWLGLAYLDRDSAADMLASLVARRTAAAQGWTRR
jgi:hypothetical protein